ncbi:hypothetical protein ACFVZI_52820, partial [Streptomyces mirabilis]
SPDTNPYLRLPDELREPADGRPSERPRSPDDVYGAPTVVRPMAPPPGPQNRRPRGRNVPPPPQPPPGQGPSEPPGPGRRN